MLEQEARQRAKPDDCDDDYFLRYGVCLGYSARGVRRPHHGPAPPSDIYRGYYRDNNNLYYKTPRKPGPPSPPPRQKTPKRPPVPGAPSSKKPAPSGQPLQGTEELLPKEALPTPARPAASK